MHAQQDPVLLNLQTKLPMCPKHTSLTAQVPPNKPSGPAVFQCTIKFNSFYYHHIRVKFGVYKTQASSDIVQLCISYHFVRLWDMLAHVQCTDSEYYKLCLLQRLSECVILIFVLQDAQLGFVLVHNLRVQIKWHDIWLLQEVLVSFKWSEMTMNAMALIEVYWIPRGRLKHSESHFNTGASTANTCEFCSEQPSEQIFQRPEVFFGLLVQSEVYWCSKSMIAKSTSQCLMKAPTFILIAQCRSWSIPCKL